MKELKPGGFFSQGYVTLTTVPRHNVWCFVICFQHCGSGKYMVWLADSTDRQGFIALFIVSCDPLYPLLRSVCDECPTDWPALVDLLIDDPRTADAMQRLLANP